MAEPLPVDDDPPPSQVHLHLLALVPWAIAALVFAFGFGPRFLELRRLTDVTTFTWAVWIGGPLLAILLAPTVIIWQGNRGKPRREDVEVEPRFEDQECGSTWVELTGSVLLSDVELLRRVDEHLDLVDGGATSVAVVAVWSSEDVPIEDVARALLQGVVQPPFGAARVASGAYAAALPGRDVETYARDVLHTLGGRGHDVRMGVALCPYDGSTAARLLQLAMAAVASGDAPVRYHDPKVVMELRKEMEMADGLRAAISQHQIETWLQPIVQASTGRVMGAEALARWRHPTLGLLQPGEFLPYTAGRGTALDLGTEVVRHVATLAARWRYCNGSKLFMSTNVVREQLEDRWSLKAFQSVLEQSGLPGEALQIEAPIEALLDPTGALIRNLHDLGSVGVRFVADAWRGEPRHLQGLRGLPLHGVKVDVRSLRNVHGLDDRRLKRAVAAVVDTGFPVHACMVETEEEIVALRGLGGVASLQGFALARPLDPAAFEQALWPRHGVRVATL